MAPPKSPNPKAPIHLRVDERAKKALLRRANRRSEAENRIVTIQDEINAILQRELAAEIAELDEHENR
jgi:hypothetical protein